MLGSIPGLYCMESFSSVCTVLVQAKPSGSHTRAAVHEFPRKDHHKGTSQFYRANKNFDELCHKAGFYCIQIYLLGGAVPKAKAGRFQESHQYGWTFRAERNMKSTAESFMDLFLKSL